MAALRRSALPVTVVVLLLCSLNPPAARARLYVAPDSLGRAQATRVYLDLPETYQEYVKTEVPYVNYMRDRALAEVHILLTEQTTGSGGTEYTITLIGRGEYATVNDTLVFAV